MDEGSTVHRERMTRLDQEEHHSRHVVGTAKLVTPFSAGIAAAFVTAGGFEGEPQWWHYLALGLMLATIGLTVWVVSTKRKGKLEFDDIELPQDRLYPRYKRVAAANRLWTEGLSAGRVFAALRRSFRFMHHFDSYDC